jgi:hypothetical protein
LNFFHGSDDTLENYIGSMQVQFFATAGNFQNLRLLLLLSEEFERHLHVFKFHVPWIDLEGLGVV